MTVTDGISLPMASDFVLPDTGGNEIRLSHVWQRGTLILVFFRGHWCPYCRRYLLKLQANHSRFVEQGASLLAISPEPVATSKRFSDELSLSFPLLCDATGRVIDLYDTRNGFTRNRALLPHASVFIIDAQGRVRFKSIDRNYKRRTTMHTIFGELLRIRYNT